MNGRRVQHTLKCNRYWGVFWIDASTRDNIQRGLVQIALILQINQDTDSVKRALANASKAWLLVFDNADDPDLALTPILPGGRPRQHNYHQPQSRMSSVQHSRIP